MSSSRYIIPGIQRTRYFSGQGTVNARRFNNASGRSVIDVLKPIDLPPSVVVWDWDRTVFDGKGDSGSAIHAQMLAEIISAKRGGNASEHLAEGETFFRRTQGMPNIARFRMLIEREGLSGSLDPQDFEDRVATVVKKYAEESLEEWRYDPGKYYIPGALDNIDLFCRRGAKQYVVTGNSWLTYEIIEHLGLSPYFSRVYGATAWSDAAVPYSKDAAFKMIALDNPGEHLLVIGDGAGELISAKSVEQALKDTRVYTAGLAYPEDVSTFSATEEELRALEPDALIMGNGFPDPLITAHALNIGRGAGIRNIRDAVSYLLPQHPKHTSRKVSDIRLSELKDSIASQAERLGFDAETTLEDYVKRAFNREFGIAPMSFETLRYWYEKCGKPGTEHDVRYEMRTRTKPWNTPAYLSSFRDGQTVLGLDLPPACNKLIGWKKIWNDQNILLIDRNTGHILLLTRSHKRTAGRNPEIRDEISFSDMGRDMTLARRSYGFDLIPGRAGQIDLASQLRPVSHAPLALETSENGVLLDLAEFAKWLQEEPDSFVKEFFSSLATQPR
jgi:phosphoglycolate phosphatase-like HAD superfamily hydrolase